MYQGERWEGELYIVLNRERWEGELYIVPRREMGGIVVYCTKERDGRESCILYQGERWEGRFVNCLNGLEGKKGVFV